MTLLRYSSHHGSTPTARAAAGRTYVKTAAAAAAGAKKSWNKSYSLTTTAAPAVKLPHTNSYQWSRQEPSQAPPSIPTFARGGPQRYNGRKTTWRRPTTQDHDAQENSQPTVASAEANVGVAATLRHREDPTTDSTSSFDQEEHFSSSYTSQVSTGNLPDEIGRAPQESKQPPSTALPERAKSPNSIAAEDLSGHDESSVSSASSSQPNVMKKRGFHQLVRQDRVEAPSHQQVQYKHDDDSKNQLPLDSSAVPLRKIAPNKLVHSHHPVKVPPNLARVAGADGAMAAAKRKLLFSKQQRRMHSHASSMAPVAKRVKLSESVVNSSSTSTGTTSTGEKLMTDFAYRETSKVPSRSGNRTLGQGHTSSLHQGRRNMGLVRVSPDEAKTPICPTFLQGIACTNESCTKRHDVPKEAATPICSFFQRQGQCSKGADCPFRHIKVNPRAIVCPSFSLLGFCQDEDCLMKHVRVPSKANHHNKTLTLKNKATET